MDFGPDARAYNLCCTVTATSFTTAAAALARLASRVDYNLCCEDARLAI